MFVKSEMKRAVWVANCSKDTIRNQLKVIFAKTDTYTQSRLAVLLLQAAGPWGQAL